MITINTVKKPAAKLTRKDLKVGSLYKFTYSSTVGGIGYYIGMVCEVDHEKAMHVLHRVGCSDTVGSVFLLPAISSGSHELFDGSITLSNE
jgi:hypothetical protein